MVSYKLVYNRKGKLDEADAALVQIEAYQQGKRRYFTTQVRLIPSQWNPKKREVRNNAQANQRIRKRLEELQNFELMFPTTHGRVFTLDDFDLMLVPEVAVQPVQTLFSEYMRNEIEADKPSVASTTYQRRNRVLNRLILHHGGPVAFAELTFAFINKFDQAKRGLFKLDDNTVEAEHKILKRYVSRAVKSGFVERNPYDQFKIKGKAVDKVILTDEEIKRIEMLTLDDEYAQLVICRDAFLLAYYTMLRVSDLITLTTKHVNETADGLLIEKIQCKTKQRVRIPMGTLHNGKGQILLRKYRPRLDGKRYINRSAQHLNRQLKEVLRLAGITKTNIGFHCARHSGITCLVRRGVPLAVIRQLAGHADIKMTMTYVHLAGVDIEQALGRVANW
ncbi:site-specific integrase [Fibrella sp. USSR17]